MSTANTSINVAKAGPAENIGSIFIFFNNIGIPLPKVTEVITTIAQVRLMMKLVHKCPVVKKTRTNAVRPKIAANIAAIKNSRCKKRFILEGFTSPENMPLITSADV